MHCVKLYTTAMLGRTSIVATSKHPENVMSANMRTPHSCKYAILIWVWKSSFLNSFFFLESSVSVSAIFVPFFFYITLSCRILNPSFLEIRQKVQGHQLLIANNIIAFTTMFCGMHFKFYLYLNLVCLKLKFIDIDSVFRQSYRCNRRWDAKVLLVTRQINYAQLVL